jgi:hypothetical protein
MEGPHKVAVDVSQVNDFDIPSISLDTEAVPLKREFLGIVTQDEPSVRQWPDGKISKKWHLAVRPVDYMIGGATGAWHMYAPVSTTEGSVMMDVVDAFREVLGSRDEDGKTRDIMKGELVGLVAHFERRDLTFERKGKGPFTFEGALFPVAPAEYEETQRAKDLPEYVPAAVSEPQGETVQEATPSDSFTEEQMDKLLDLLDGRNDVEAAREAASDPAHYSDIRQAVVSTRGAQAAQDAGLLTKTTDGRYARIGT